MLSLYFHFQPYIPAFKYTCSQLFSSKNGPLNIMKNVHVFDKIDDVCQEKFEKNVKQFCLPFYTTYYQHEPYTVLI